eukprot:gene1792-1958_t
MKPPPSDVSISGVVRLPGHLTAPFREFNSRELPLSALGILSLFTTLYAIPMVGSLAFSFDEDKSRVQIALVKLTGALNIPVIILCWLTLYFRYSEKHSPERMTAAKCYIGSMVQNAYSNFLTLSLAVQLCARMAYGECKGDSVSEQAFCNPNHSTHGLPEASLLSVVWTPIMFAIIMRDTDWNAIVLNWLIATVTIPYCVIKYQPIDMTNIGVAFVIPICTASAIYSNQLQNVRSFVIQQQLAAPLASFVSGLDMVADIAQDGLRKLSSIDNCSSEDMVLYDGSHYKNLAKEVRGWLEGVLLSRVEEIGPGSVCQLPGDLMQSSSRDGDDVKTSLFRSDVRIGLLFDVIRRNRRTTAVSALAAGLNRSTSTVGRVDESNLHLTSSQDSQSKAVLTEQPSIVNTSTSGDLFLLLLRLGAHYIAIEKRESSEGVVPLDDVARFHLRNGSVFHSINWMGNPSGHGLNASAGMMVNYLYDFNRIEENAARFGKKNEVIPMGEKVRNFLRLP